MSLQKAYEKNSDRADFYWVYVLDAVRFSEDQKNLRLPEYPHENPKTFELRSEAATMCANDIKLDIPILVDSMENTAAKMFEAAPDRLYILASDGTIAYQGQPGPFGFNVEEMTATLEQLLEAQ